MIQQVAAGQFEVAGVDNAVAIAAADEHACAIISGGTVKCWGRDMRGELGDGKAVIVGSPTTVSFLDDAESIAAGVEATCVIHKDASISCWGQTTRGSWARDRWRTAATCRSWCACRSGGPGARDSCRSRNNSNLRRALVPTPRPPDLRPHRAQHHGDHLLARARAPACRRSARRPPSPCA
jgi:hypothetical protein